MKRIVLLAVSIIFSICTLVGCGDNTSDTYSETTSEPIATSTTYSEQEQYYLDNYYRAKHILIRNENRTNLEAEELCTDLYKQVQNGKDFDLLIQEYSEDPGCAKNPDGYFFTDGQMVIEFENAVKSIDIGEFTTCKSDYGYHVIQRLALDETPEIFEEGYKNNVADSSNKVTHFAITKDEFIEQYNMEFKKLNDNDMIENAYSELLKADRCSVQTPDDTRIPNATKMYKYNQTSGRIPKELKIYTDKNENCVAVTVACSDNISNAALSFQIDTVCRAAYIAITKDNNYDNYVASTTNVQTGNGYEYAFSNGGGTIFFTIMPGNYISDIMN